MRKHRDPTELVLHEEELELGAKTRVAGVIRARKSIESETVSDTVPRSIEEAGVERVAPNHGDSGEIETLPDGSISIPVLEEELVVTKRVVVRERIVIRKETKTQHEVVKAELRKERVEIEGGDE